MLALIQRVSKASVMAERERLATIGPGLLVLLGIEREDGVAEADRLLHKVLGYRVFADADGKMNLSLRDVRGDLLVVSQFTLAASTDQGLRPGFSSAKVPAEAEYLYRYFLGQAQQSHQGNVAAGSFGANMQVTLVNDGPVTFLLRANGKEA